MGIMDQGTPAAEPSKVIQRETPDVPPERAAAVTELLDDVKAAKAHWSKQFDKMRRDMKFARGKQWPKQTENDERYVANIMQQHIDERVSAIYARNPKVVAKRKPRLEFAVWDGTQESLQEAQTVLSATAAGIIPPGMSKEMVASTIAQATAILDDVRQAKERIAMLDRLGKTLEILFQNQLDEGTPKFKIQAKQLVCRAKTCGVGFVKVAYQRIMGRPPEADAKLKDTSDRIAELERLSADVADGIVNEGDAEMERLRLLKADIERQDKIVLREGLIFDFPRSYAVYPDEDCTQLKGFVGARLIIQEFVFTKKKIQKIFGVDIGSKFTAYNEKGVKAKGGGKACVFEVYDMETQMVCHVCDGYPDYITEPKSADSWLEQIHPFFVLSFNDVEDDEDIYPPSDVERGKHIQLEWNRSREGLRQHRIANRPGYVSASGVFGKDDKSKLMNHESSEIMELDGIAATGEGKIQEKLMAKPTVPIDPLVYDTQHLSEDQARTMGSQPADLEMNSNVTATASGIASTQRASTTQSDVDDLDEFLTDMARACGQLLLCEMSKETVMRIVGPGAVWPEYDRQSLAEEVYLEIRAGSSGRPNRALDIANMERMAPFLLQIPGIPPAWLAERIVRVVDETIDLSEAYIDGLPSIIAMNGMAQPGTGDPATDPNAQGNNGANNKPVAGAGQPGAQAAAPLPTGGSDGKNG